MIVALTIAGSDSGAGAGIQADLKTFHQFRVFGTTVITAITAQNTRGVTAVHPVPPDMVDAQISALASDLPPRAFKTGMLATEAIARAVARAIARYELPNYVMDPVMVATSGDRLLSSIAESALRDVLMPLAVIVTPNLPEAAILTGKSADTVADQERAGKALLEIGAGAALIKGGHGKDAEVTDVLVTKAGVRHYRHRRIDTRSTHGTGCTLSAGITAGLALGKDLERAVSDALEFVHRAIAAAEPLGAGHGPLNHWV